MTKKLYLITGVIFLFSHFCFSQTPANDPAWNIQPLKLSDDFNSVNSSTWSIWNTESSYWNDFCFVPSKVNINNAILPGDNVLELKALNDHVCSSGKAISSGGINSNSTYLYGYYEANCEFASTGPSYMPAFWLYMSSNCDCGNGGNSCSGGWYDEIDVEIFSYPSPTPFDLTTNFHYKRPGNCPGIDDFANYTPVPGLQNNFHKYGIEWTPDHVILYYDDQPFRIKNTNIPDHAMNILFDLGFRASINTSNTFPGYQYVNYIKVYDLSMSQCATTDVTINTPFNSSTYDFKVKRNIIFANGNSSVINSGNITLRASKDITINGDFTVQGADFTILPTQCY